MEPPLSQPFASGQPADSGPTPIVSSVAVGAELGGALRTPPFDASPAPPAVPAAPRVPAPPHGPLAPDERRRRGRRRQRHNRHLRDALTHAQRVSLACFIASWSVLSVFAWGWWFAPGHGGPAAALIVNTGLLAVESLVLPIWFFSWLWRMRRPDPALTVPKLRVAMVVTKAPSEPWPMVRHTLEAMLAQDFPFPYDTWLADERPEPETLRWCEEHGVRVSSRHGVADYHRPTWPRRTRCKEGNLAYFYDHWGYDLYDVVAQLDADHVPEPDYLHHMVTPFTDPQVGYVAAPSICDRNAARSWSGRARLYAEAVLHGPMQAGHSGGCAPSCIGSHYAVRTAALQEIGGLGPELAEDFTTSLMMSSHRWQGVFAIDAHAHGDGPETLADCMTQEFQWSRSMMNVLLGINQRYWSGLSRMAKLRLGFCQVWYPLFAVLMLASIVLPLVAIVTRTPLMRVTLSGFYVHFVPPTLVLLGVVLWLRSLQWLRPNNAKAVSWELALFQLVRWPWVLIGCLHAIAGRIAGREFEFKVTPKGGSGARALPLRVILPYLIIGAISAIPAVLHLDAGAAHGYDTLALINVALYLFAAVAVVALHVYDHPVDLRRQVRRLVSTKLLATASAAGALGLAALAPAPWSLRAPAPHPRPVPASGSPRLALGVTTAALASNSTRAWTADDLFEVNAFEQAAGAHASVVLWYADWASAKIDPAQLRAVAQRGATPEITWEPWDYRVGLHHAQPGYTLASIISGRHDAYIRGVARTLRAFGRPVLLRFAQEMNGDWYPWGVGINGNRPGQFAAAWRHVHDLFGAAGATNVRWVWSPVARYGVALSTAQYPGAGYVDVIGLSGFNGGSALPWTGWRSFASLFDASLATVHALAPAKPVQISEVGSAASGGSKANWISAMFADLAHHPEVRTVIWFDVDKQTDWRITSSPAAARAFATALRGAQRVPRARAARGSTALSRRRRRAPWSRASQSRPAARPPSCCRPGPSRPRRGRRR